MRKIICLLIVFQSLIASIYGVLFLREYTLHSILNDGTSSLFLVIDNEEEYKFLLDLVEKEELTITRTIHLNEDNLMIYTSDFSLNGKINLLEGRWPSPYTSEFVSTEATKESTQVGLIERISPNVNISISRIENTTNVELHGTYLINSVELEFLRTFIEVLNNNISRAELLSINDNSSIFQHFTSTQFIEVVVISFLLLMCIIATLTNYSIHKLKVSAVYMTHGYNKIFILMKILSELIILLIFSYTLSYILILSYMLLTEYVLFIIPFSQSFLMIGFILIFIYIILCTFFLVFYLNTVRGIELLKGRRPYRLIQFFNFSSKTILTTAVVIFASLAVNTLLELTIRSEALSNWSLAENVHSTRIYSVGQSSDLSIDLEIIGRKLDFFDMMVSQHDAFIMNASNISFLDRGIMPYADMNTAPPMYLSPHGNSVTISSNFLKFNPIVDIYGRFAINQIIYNPYVLNILVPEDLSNYETKITESFLDYFYFRSVGIDNIYNSELGYSMNTTPREQLSLNIIYVENNQEYFSFDNSVRVQEMNMIKDPIAIIYTGSLHPSDLSMHIGGHFFFITESFDAYSSIHPLLVESGLTHVIRSTVSIFNQNGREIFELRNQLITSILLLIVLIISSFVVVYSLTSNYFEQNRLKIFIKGVFGYKFTKRHSKFLLMTLSFNIAVIVLLSTLLGNQAIIIGTSLVVLEQIFIMVIDGKLMKINSSKIIKGS